MQANPLYDLTYINDRIESWTALTIWVVTRQSLGALEDTTMEGALGVLFILVSGFLCIAGSYGLGSLISLLGLGAGLLRTAASHQLHTQCYPTAR